MKLAVALLALLMTAQASGPVAVFALIEKVTFEPSADKPERIVLTGLFTTSRLSANNDTLYEGPQKGSMYYSLPTGADRQRVLNEWQDLKSIAGSRQVVGYGASWAGHSGVVRKDGEGLGTPNDWPTQNGIIRVDAARAEARDLLAYKGK